MRSWSTAGARFFKMDYERVLKRLVEYAEKTVARGAKAVILVGSLARGDYTAFSDADIIIISDEVSENPIKRASDLWTPRCQWTWNPSSLHRGVPKNGQGGKKDC